MMLLSRCTFAVLIGAGLWASTGLAQPAPGRPQGREPRSAEVARLFDAYAIVQAQEMLGLDEEQYARFVSRFKALQEVRREHEQARVRHIRELVRMTEQASGADDAAIGAELSALADAEAKAAEDVREAVKRIDEVLTVRQRARFRVLENQLERRKLELMMRARQAAPRDPERRLPPRLP